MERKPVVVGNWKMELSHKASTEAALSIKKLLKNITLKCEVVVCPSYPALAAVKEVFGKTTVAVGAQNVHWEERGAWTGQVSVSQIMPFAAWSIVGHSEQRALTGETEDEVTLKASLLLQHGIAPIVCIGESREEREAEQTVTKVTQQIQHFLSKMTRTSLSKVVIAYEPIWAIGSGQMPEPSDVAEIMLLIRKQVAGRFGNEAADKLRILYGGSVTPTNVAPYMAEPGVDGVLVGGASTHPMQFVEIIKTVQGKAA